MIDAEVMRLRGLRRVALRARAMAHALDPGAEPHQESIVAMAAVVCWRIAGVVTGRLRAHPYLSFQRDHGYWRSVADRLAASTMGHAARRRPLNTVAAQLELVARELDDARALTWLPDLSDTLGRAQVQLRKVMRELAMQARCEASVPFAAARVVARVATPAVAPVMAPVMNVFGDAPRQSANRSGTAPAWPYLAI
jgi:hypothetical protein